MDSEEAAHASAKEKHNKYMVMPGKNQKIRYIEVFQVRKNHSLTQIIQIKENFVADCNGPKICATVALH